MTHELQEMIADGRLPSIGGGSPGNRTMEAIGKFIRDGVHSVNDAMNELGGSIAPRTARMAQSAADAIARHTSASVYSQRASEYYIDRVLGKEATMEDRRFVGSTLTEMRLRYIKEAYAQRSAAELKEAVRLQKIGDVEEAAKHRRASVEAQAAEENVGTIIGRENSPLTDEAAYQRALKDPKFTEAMDRYRAELVPLMEENFKKAQGLEEHEDINSFTQMPDLPVNLKAISEGDPMSQGAVIVGLGRGNLRNPTIAKFGFAKQAKGSAHGYDIDMGAIIENSIYKGTAAATKAELYRQAESNGIGKWGDPVQKIEGYREIPNVRPPKGTQAAEKGQTSFYVKDAAYGEMREALAPDRPINERVAFFGATKAASNVTTRLALISLVEATTHAKNNFTFLFNPGVSWNPIKLGETAWKVAMGNDAVNKKLVDLAQMGAMKGKGLESGNLWGGKTDPTVWTGKFLDVIDSTMRLVADDAFSNLAKSGRVKDTETNRRDFINQLGNYNKRTQSGIVSFLRDTGIGPFATAGTNYTMQGLRSVTMNPGVEATSYKQAALLRLEKTARIAAVLAIVPITNYLLWKRLDGDENVPLGGIKVGTKDGRTQYLDLGSLTGIKRGSRLIGLNAIVEGARAGAPVGSMADRAVEEAGHSLLHPAQGPAVQAAYGAWTGENLIGGRIAKRPTPGTHESAMLLKLQGVLWNANPLIQSISGATRPELHPTTPAWQMGFPNSQMPYSERAAGAIGPALLGGLKTRGSPPGIPLTAEQRHRRGLR